MEKMRRHVPHYENEQLCELNIDLKKTVNELKIENKQLKAKNIKLGVTISYRPIC